MTLIFNMTRKFGFVSIQNYVPCSMTTMLSWVSFWIRRDAAPARASLGITTVLTMTTLGTFSRKNLPRASYLTSLDFYIAVCFFFCFCALLEFAILNFLTYSRPDATPRLRHPPRRSRRGRRPSPVYDLGFQGQGVFVCELEGSDSDDEEDFVPDLPSCPTQQEENRARGLRSRRCNKWYQRFLCANPDCQGRNWQRGRLYFHVYRMDNYSRVIFPVSFFFFNVIYWLLCLNL